MIKFDPFLFRRNCQVLSLCHLVLIFRGFNTKMGSFPSLFYNYINFIGNQCFHKVVIKIKDA